MAEQLYYVQDNRQYVGNCVLWWAKDHKGYTCDLDRAHVFTKDEMWRICGSHGRGSDIPWRKDVIDKLIVHHVDAQRLPHRKGHLDGNEATSSASPLEE